MLVLPELEQGERWLFSDMLPAPNPKKGGAFALLVSDRALFLLRSRRLAIRDPWYFERIPLRDVTLVELVAQRASWSWGVAASCIALGTWLLTQLIPQGLGPERAKPIGYSVALVVVGLVIPFAARGRLTLHVKLSNGTFKWRPTLTVGGPYSSLAREYLVSLAHAIRSAGVHTKTEEEPPRGAA